MRITMVGFWLFALLFPVLVHPAARSPEPGFDCNKARTPVEKAICRDAALADLDARLQRAYAEAAARAPERQDRLRREQQQWLAERDQRCNPPLKAGQEAAALACLREWYEARVLVLSGSLASPPAPQAAVVSPAELPAQGKQAAYLEVPVAGRYAIGARSKTGVALELIDYMNGPTARDGDPGQRDGRLDVFLDRGRYKLILRGAPQAQDTVTVTARPFVELQSTPQRLPLLEPVTGELADYQQRSYWVEVKERGPVFLEAGGRYLDAMHLWRDGLTLLESSAERRTSEPQAGRPLTVLILDTVLDPGFYRVTLYGGRERVPWTQESEEKPLYLRLGVPRIEHAARQWRAIGPLGIDRFIVATPASDYGRLELPAATAVQGETASIERGGIKRPQGTAFAFTNKTRWPVWETSFDSNTDRLVTLQGRRGQGYVWQNFKRVWEGDLSQQGGEYWLELISAGDERDHPPLTAVLAWPQNPKDPSRPNWQILTSNAPRFGQDSTWNGRFNVLGPTEMLIEIAVAGEFEIQTQGVPLTATLKPLLATDNPNIRPRAGPRWTLETGFYRLELAPAKDQRGIVEVRFQSVGLPAGAGNPVTVAAPRFPSLKLPGATRLFLNQRPQVPVGLFQRDLPLSLREPLFVTLAAAESLELAVVLPGRGSLAAWDERGQSRPLVVDGGPAGNPISVGAGPRKIRLNAPEESATALSLQWRPDPVPPAPLPAGLGQTPQQAPPTLREEQPLPLELVADRDQSVAIEARESGLFRLETTGRLRTQGRLRTHLVPRVAEAEANGVGHNFLIQHYLRAGHYLLSAGSRQGSAGHARLSLSRAPLRDGGPLSFETPARATLAAGEGAVYRFAVPPPGGHYQVQAIGLAQPYPLRLEDAEGWPILPPGQAGSLSAELEAGDYRLVVIPTDVAGRVLVNVVGPTVEPATLQGHGPHPLPLNGRQAYRWLEPAREGEPRVPDQWTFALVGETDLRLDITEGMRGELQRLDDRRQWQDMGRFSDRKAYRGRVPAGEYRATTEALGRNNQLDYTIGAWTEQLIPGQLRKLDSLPAKVTLSVDRDRVVEIASLGRRDVRATLRDAAGRRLAGDDDRADGWDFLVSRQLKAGHYELTVEEVDLQRGEDESDAGEDASAEESGEATDEESTEETAEEDQAESPATVRDGGRNAWIDEQDVWVALRLPGEAPAPALPLNGDVELADGNARVFPLSATDVAGCRLFAARSAGELTLALEQQEPAGGWRVLDTASGRSAWLAMWPANAGPARRLRVWGNDGGRVSILLQSRSLDARPQTLGPTMLWERIAGIEPPLGMALVELPAAQAVRVPWADPMLRSASQPGDVLQAASDEILIPQGRRLWLLKPVSTDESLVLVPVTPTGSTTVQLTVPAGRAARLPTAPAEKDRLVAWEVDSRLGQPGIDAGDGMGVAANDSAVAVAGSAGEVRLWRADAPDASLPVVLRRHDLRVVAGETASFGMGGAQLATGEARLLRLPAGTKRLRLDLPARTAAILGWGNSKPSTLWTGDRALSHEVDTGVEALLLVNLGGSAAPVSWSLAPLPAGPTQILAPGMLFRRFEPAAGVLLLQAEGRAGLELVTQGQEVSTTVVGADGSVRRGNRVPLAGPAWMLLRHGPGLLAAWLNGEGSDPWPRVPARPVEVPSVLALSGPAQVLQVEFDRPVMLYGRGSAPLLAGMRRDGQPGLPVLHPQGARFAYYLPPGRGELLLLPPQEGELAGVLELQASNVQTIGEGLGQPLMLAPGGARLFGFHVAQPGLVGVGVQATPDVVTSRLLDAQGQLVGEGVVQMPRLAVGDYVLEVTVPAAGSPVRVRPALVGIAPPPAGPPPEVRQQFRAWLKADKAQGKK
ncbi:MAG: lysozyme inhibitor LprI family protein [Candidatus Competibacter sp.]|nr:lysozyme inhibitor LprI family protein [Candidatus Competibacter sp.]